MIAHLPLASHPNPKKVLVIGGGDGGVVREVLKHDTVEQVVLCDIDEVSQISRITSTMSHVFLILCSSNSQAVIRVSKKYLPHMSNLLSDPRVVVHIGDGFKFLAENTSTYDAIITDSSDPVGPAASLFQKPYFELLHGALAPGGHISTQAECLWLHLPLINELRKTTRALFPVAEYAFTTIPTYPSGQIGFVVCSKEAGRDVKTPLRKVSPTRYYNQAVHKAAFVLPEFGRALAEDGQNILPKIGKQFDSTKPVKKILLLGSGFVARPAAEYIAREPNNRLTIGKFSPCHLSFLLNGGLCSLPYTCYCSRASSRFAERYWRVFGCDQPRSPREGSSRKRSCYLARPVHLPRSSHQSRHQGQD